MRSKIISQEINNSIVSLEEAMEHSRITDSYDEMVIQGCLDAAHDLVQNWVNRLLYPSVVVQQVNNFRFNVTLPYPPIKEIVSVVIEDSSHNDIILVEDVDFKFDTFSDTVRFLKDFSSYTNFRITFNAGYQTTEEVPKAISHAIKMTFASLYENRENEIIGTQVNTVPISVSRVLSAYRVGR